MEGGQQGMPQARATLRRRWVYRGRRFCHQGLWVNGEGQVCVYGGGGVRPPTIYPSHKLISAKREPAAAAQSITQVADGAGGHGLGATSWRCLPTWLSVFHTRAVWSLEVDSSRPGTSGDHSTAKARDLRRCGAVRGGARRPQCMVVERRQDADTTLELGGWLAPHHTAAVA